MSHIIRILFIALSIFLPTFTLSSNADKTLAKFYIFNENIEDKYNIFVEKKLKEIGFDLTDPHKRVNDHYKSKWGSSVLDLLSFMPVVNAEVVLPLLNIDPRIAGFAPFNMLIYKKSDENTTHVGHLMPNVMLDILDIKNEEVRKKFYESFSPLDKLIEDEFDTTASYTKYTKLPEKTMINFEYYFDEPEDMDDFIDEFQNKFSLSFIQKGYLIAGYYDFMFSHDDAEDILSEYDAFWTYSLCHLEFSYNIFDRDNARPEAGLFAPCTMYMYIKKGSNKIVGGMFRLRNWSETLNITNAKRLKLIENLDKEIPEILTSLGMHMMPNINPLLAKNKDIKYNRKNKTKNIGIKKINHVSSGDNRHDVQRFKVGDRYIDVEIPKVPTAIKIDNNSDIIYNNRKIKFSKRVPPGYQKNDINTNHNKNDTADIKIGEVNKGVIAAYLRGSYIEVEALKNKLLHAGFDIVATTPVNKKGTLISIIFTNDDLLKMATKRNRGFMASLRALVDTEEKTVSIVNPLYLAKGFLQDDFDEKSINNILMKLIHEFPNFQNSKDVFKYQKLSRYQLLAGQPKYEDMQEVASGDNLLEKIDNNKNVVFVQKITKDTTLIGVKLRKKTTSFTKRIGRRNAGMLPYPILISNGKARILDPKYYISYMYPMLSMSEFMTIATVPGAILRDCQKIFD